MPVEQAPNWTSIVEALSWAGAVLTAALGAWKFFAEQKKARLQRDEEIKQRQAANDAVARELEWRRAGAAWTSIEKLESDRRATDAMLMLDWDGRSIPRDAAPEDQWTISQQDMLSALRTKGSGFTEQEVYVRDAFDRLFWHFEWIQSQIDADLIELRHVRFPFAYLVAHMTKEGSAAVFEEFLKEYCYAGAIRLIEALKNEGLPTVPADYRTRFAYQRDEAAQEGFPAGRAQTESSG